MSPLAICKPLWNNLHLILIFMKSKLRRAGATPGLNPQLPERRYIVALKFQAYFGGGS